MTDIPFFTGEGGLSTLILREISDKKAAHVIVRACGDGQIPAHLALCAAFCRSAGAARVYACLEGGRLLSDRTPDYELLLLSAPVQTVPGPLTLVPESLSLETAAGFADIYNRCFADTLNCEGYSEKSARTLLDDSRRRGFLYRRAGALAGISELTVSGSEAELSALGVLPEFRGGAGGQILAHVLGLAAALGAETLNAKVMSTNVPALRLYEKAGFTHIRVISTWFLI